MKKSFAIFLIGLDRARASTMQRMFVSNGWQIFHFPDVKSFRSMHGAEQPGLALVECEHSIPPENVIQALGNAPCIAFLTESCTDPSECGLKWLDAGADFFIGSYGERLLLAKVRAHLRRMLPKLARDMERIQAASITLDTDRRMVLHKKGTAWLELTRLTDTETRLLAFLTERPGEVLPPRDILTAIWGGRSGEVNTEIVCKYLSRLRRKLGPKGRLIRSVYGKGYVYQA